jgi:hypothetical protein
MGVLKHVGRVDAPLQPPVEAEPHHALQELPGSGEQLGQCPLVPASQAAEQVVIVSYVLVGRGCYSFRFTARHL